MNRVADSTIRGFLFQFNVTLLELLGLQSGESVTVEGLVEDVDVVRPSGMTAIQCKYHDSESPFVLSAVYKPLLQMMLHFNDNPRAAIEYRLFVHFRDQDNGETRNLTEADISAVLSTQDRTLSNLVTRVGELKSMADFIGRTRIEFGPSLDEVEQSVRTALRQEGFDEDEIGALHYPNSIYRVSMIAAHPEAAERTITNNMAPIGAFLSYFATAS